MHGGWEVVFALSGVLNGVNISIQLVCPAFLIVAQATCFLNDPTTFLPSFYLIFKIIDLWKEKGNMLY